MIAKITDDKTIEVYDLSQFDIDATMHSGQVFRYRAIDGGYAIVVGDKYAEVKTIGDKAVITTDDTAYFWNYFDLDEDYSVIKAELGKYPELKEAIATGGGIRILKSDFYEMAISFIISANNNIKRFTKTLNLLSEKYGKKLNDEWYGFPTLKAMESITNEEYKELGCGYRSEYLVEAVKQLEGIDGEELGKLTNAEVDKVLRSVKGIGPKVSACIMLFSGNLHRLDVVPIDTWIKKAIAQLGENGKEIFGGKYAGIAQQYIFYYMQYKREQLA